MKVAVFSARPYDRAALTHAAQQAPAARVAFEFFEAHLEGRTAVLAERFDAVCPFVNDSLDATVLKRLHDFGIRMLALRCAGYNNVDLAATAHLGLTVVRVPAYSPEAVAEQTIARILALNRKVYRAYNRVREGFPRSA